MRSQNFTGIIQVGGQWQCGAGQTFCRVAAYLNGHMQSEQHLAGPINPNPSSGALLSETFW